MSQLASKTYKGRLRKGPFNTSAYKDNYAELHPDWYNYRDYAAGDLASDKFLTLDGPLQGTWVYKSEVILYRKPTVIIYDK